ncbi:TonB-dependent receptor [Pelomonas sp. CA6]|uniref:TonB-dependent receptor n=1 Tax=Pelomonas sp. CA6 TaxID=2907999 RepID=UPI001F4B50D0|nr:TonB-dependent receptor [Pelomonas sp. CA6]MCH7342982.1 TonB-dependent receptor [Pelomonas sp. CA6]
MKVRQTPIAAAVTITLLSATLAHAQQAENQTDKKAEPSQLEQVVVTGIRASLQTAVNIKKNANAVVDAVSAEDIGKLPDSDVGQSLGRIPGVSVGRAFGQGASVSVRGSDPQMTYTTLNGQTVASTGWYDQQTVDRSFNYSLLPPELIGGMEVYKSSQADLTEGGIGGTVIVKTRKPLDLPAGSAFVGVKLGKGTVSKDLNKEVSGLFSWKDSRQMFGVLVAGAIENGEYMRRGIESDARWSGDVAPTTFVQDRKRTAINVNLQARPAAGFDLGLNYIKLELTGDNSNTSHYLFPGQNAQNCQLTNAAGLCIKSNTTAANATTAFVQTWARTGKMTSDSLVLNGSYKADAYKLDVVGGTTKAKGGTSQTINFGDGGAALPKWTGSIDATGKQIEITPASNQDVTLANLPAKMAPTGWATSLRAPNSDKETFVQADLTMDLNWGVISSFKTGLRATKHTFSQYADRAVFKADFDTNPITAPTSSLYNGSMAMGTPGWNFPKPDIGAMVALTNQNIAKWIEQRANYVLLEEKNKSAYGMFEFDKDELHGNFGVRYIQTNVLGSGYKFDGTPLADGDVSHNTGWSTVKATQTSKYHDFLPSLNVAYNLDKNTILRFAAAKTMTRPNFENMFLTKQEGYNDDRAGNETLTYGTVALKPMKSKQFDLGIEYYYGRGNMVSVAYFHKSIDNFITALTKVDQKIGVVDPKSGKDSWTVNQYVNAGGGKINGIEAQINHSFANGFGVVANYTYSDAKAPSTSYQDELNMFTLASKHNVNLVGFWENADYSARLAYNWRSKYMIRETGWYGNRMHDAYGTLDLSLGWNVTKNIRLSFEAANLLKQDDKQYGAAATTTTVKAPLQVGYPAWSFMGETTYRLGLSAKF